MSFEDFLSQNQNFWDPHVRAKGRKCLVVNAIFVIASKPYIHHPLVVSNHGIFPRNLHPPYPRGFEGAPLIVLCLGCF